MERPKRVELLTDTFEACSTSIVLRAHVIGARSGTRTRAFSSKPPYESGAVAAEAILAWSLEPELNRCRLRTEQMHCRCAIEALAGKVGIEPTHLLIQGQVPYLAWLLPIDRAIGLEPTSSHLEGGCASSCATRGWLPAVDSNHD